MTSSTGTTRRAMLRILAGAPCLPILQSTVLSLAGGMPAWAASPNKALKSVDFIGMAAPATAKDQALTTVGSKLVATYDDGAQQTFDLGHTPFFVTGDSVPDGKGGQVIAGGYLDINNQPIHDPSAPDKRQFFSDCPDGSSLLKVDGAKVPGVKGNPLFAVVQFEYTSRAYDGSDMYGKLPSPIAVLTLDQNPDTGELSLVQYHPVDTSGVNGLWITCGGSLSPWNTHLSSEEYEPDATKAKDDDEFKAFSANLFGDPAKANPYHYGHLPEVTVNTDGTGSIKKHYCLGRISHELVQVMPDQRTTLMGDDATNGGLFMFIADKPADLSSGRLYVAKVTQQDGVELDKGGRFDLDWVFLGEATSDEIMGLADSLTAADILDVAHEDPKDASFTKIRRSGKEEWVKVKPGMEKAAAFLETHRYAPLAGGTLAFTKMEGTTVNAKDKIGYSAMSYIYKSMSDGKNPIKVDQIKAGAVYAWPMEGGKTDTAGNAIPSDWVPVSLAAVPALVGRDLAEPDAVGNTADVDRIANPDNIKFSERWRTLFIGEDSGMHVNNFLWAYNVDTQKLSRILSCPAGAESTGLHAVDDLNGFSYVMSNFQHPGDWGKGLHDKVKAELEPLENAAYHDRFGGGVGYIHGIPKAG
ncbi:PhoX family protein [Rhodospirillum sp. A1_3_36]|uniref:PhoX family protein n=1 Tax=Rhodospirillum sp. A1_3_36 TaxID=3391666 RepID=UPI0039A4102F